MVPDSREYATASHRLLRVYRHLSVSETVRAGHASGRACRPPDHDVSAPATRPTSPHGVRHAPAHSHLGAPLAESRSRDDCDLLVRDVELHDRYEQTAHLREGRCRRPERSSRVSQVSGISRSRIHPACGAPSRRCGTIRAGDRGAPPWRRPRARADPAIARLAASHLRLSGSRGLALARRRQSRVPARQPGQGG